MKFRTELLDPHPLLKAIRGSAFWQDIIERLVEPETPPKQKEPEKKGPDAG